jgi:HPt (histidine-containing phosphotransfer) domain-containing protein
MAEANYSELFAKLWEERRPNVFARLTTLAEAATAISSPEGLSDPLRTRALEEAHKLVGSLGTFGFPTASDRAREIETELGRPYPNATLLQNSLKKLQAEVSAGPPRHQRGA